MKEITKKIVGCFEIKHYEIEDMINILLNNNYCVEVEKCTENTVIIIVNKLINESEGK